MNRRLLLLAPLLGLGARADVPGVGYTALAGIEGLRTPTDVAFRADGALAVADPSARTVGLYGADGALRWTWSAGDGPAPVGLAVDGDRLWVAGDGELVALDPDGHAVATIDLPGLRATDVAPARDGLWVAAAPDDRLVRIDGAGVERASVPELHGPRGLVADDAGGVWVTEGTGGRILHVDAGGAVAHVAGGWGLGAGQFLAPRGLARADDGSLVVADAHQGIAVALAPDGAFVRTVSDGGGAIGFTHPLGVAVDGDRLAVADAAAGRVALLRRGGPARGDGRWPAEQWLFRASTVRDADPSTTCRQCHDGTRVDTLSVWDPGAHGHPTTPGPRAVVPEAVPIAQDGSLRCTSCHAIHAIDPSEQDDPDVMRGAEVSAVATGPIRFACVDCHPGAWSSAGRIGHPLGVEAPPGSGLRLADGRVACETCHVAHGAGFDGLTVRRLDDGALCLSCHADHGPTASHHPIGTPASPAATAFISGLGGLIGAGDTLTCLSCHDPHGARERHLLRADGTQSACAGCHEQRVAGGHEDEACAGCHGMHRSPTPDGRPRACEACHDTRAAHPRVDGASCTQCHAPHDPTPVACASCHEELGARLAGGPHDASVHPVRGATDACGSCHRPHDRDTGRYLLGPSTVDANPAVARCLACHDGSTSAPTVSKWAHPPNVLLVATGPAGAEPPYQGPDGEPAPAGKLGAITCRTCHDSHAPGQRRDVAAACAACHGDEAAELVRAFHTRAGEAP